MGFYQLRAIVLFILLLISLYFLFCYFLTAETMDLAVVQHYFAFISITVSTRAYE